VSPRTPGFRGLVEAGLTPEQAWADIRAGCQDPAVRAIIADLETTQEGRDTLEWSRIQWAQHGLPAPWEDPP
jgi:hypothetical protein